ncbi:kunitz-type anticoagulant protein Ir-CPI-like [Oratosquilla oratoria]|uniref:kunitz-type anticoagulant protein Ir-CPI-like n=1 Tax=Oratosquilla oratoria TaxID=337810 RepID=UPI003F772058
MRTLAVFIFVASVAILCYASTTTILPESEQPSYCFLKPTPALCGPPQTRYHFDNATDTCKPFIFNGCGGNRNNFITVQQCVYACRCCKEQAQQQGLRTPPPFRPTRKNEFLDSFLFG